MPSVSTMEVIDPVFNLISPGRVMVQYLVEETVFLLFCERRNTYVNYLQPAGGLPSTSLRICDVGGDQAFVTYPVRKPGSTCILLIVRAA
jgi:hypothetical protein